MIEAEDYKKVLESMSKEELLHEISNLISDHGIQLEQLKEEKKTLIWLNQDLEKRVSCLKQGMEEKNTYEEKLNSMIDNLRDDISEQKAEIERLTEKYQNAHREGYEHGKLENQYEIAELAIENAELQKQVDELKEEMHKKCLYAGLSKRQL